MKLHFGFGALVMSLAIAACGSSNPGTPSASTTAAAASAGSSTGSVAGSSTGGSSSGGVTGSSTGNSTGGSSTGTSAGSSTGATWMVSTFAGNAPSNGSCGAFGTDNSFSPKFLGLDSDANVYVTSSGIGVDKITPSKMLSVLATIMGNAPSGFCVDPTGSAFYSQNISFGEHTQIDSIKAAAVIFDQAPSCTDGEVSSGTVGFGSPAGIAVDSSGNIYVADANCYKVRVLSADGQTISTVAGTGTEGLKNGTGDVAQFSQLSSIAIDANGNLYIAESDIGDVREITPDGTTSSLTGAANSLGGMAVGADGTVYFSDTQLGYIKQIDPNTRATTVIAGTGEPGFKDGPGKQAQFDAPAGVGVDPNTGNVYVADSSNCRIRLLTPPTTP